MPTPASAKVQIFRRRANHGVGSEIGRSSSVFRKWYPHFEVEKDFTIIVRFRNKNVPFSGFFR